MLALLLAAGLGLFPSAGFAQPAQPQGWTTSLPDADSGPHRFVAVDKSSQSFYLLERHSPLQVNRTVACATGKKIGDKFLEGDERTPEGVYFIQHKRTSGLNYDLYGDAAYVLDFPNPVDRLKGKTGYGIWIHGRGHEITPRETLGCVALNNPDLTELDGELTPGTPVIIAKKLTWPADGPSFAAEADDLKQRVQDWASAWSLGALDKAAADDYFSYYLPESYSKAEGRSFASFRRHKARLFGRYDWIRVLPVDVTVLPGPDYRVTTFGQLYMAPGMLSLSTKRLYWQRDEDGQYRIVGTVVDRAPEGLKSRALELFRPQVAAAVQAWRQAWLNADVDAYAAFYGESARQQNRRGQQAIAEYKRQLWAEAPPAKLELGEPNLTLTSRGVEVSFRQDYASATGYGDSGRKTLLLVPQGQTWTIAEEDWSPIN